MTPQYAILALNLIPSLGSIRIGRLLEFFGSAELVLHADETMLCQVRGIGSEMAAAIRGWKTLVNPDKELELAEQAGVSITTIFDANYPTALRDLPDPPLVLYHRGSWTEADGEKSVAIVGTRRASAYGRLVTRKMTNELVECGVTIISGLAKGIDTEAHEAALASRGRTIAIIGSGMNHIYPESNIPLSYRIADGHGAVVSEFPMNMLPSKTTFPMRNRIVSGWSRATLVVEAPNRSGSLITANIANEQGRLVYAVPGPIDRPSSEGCHTLIREGAILATSARHIIDDFHWQASPDPEQQELPLFDTKGITSTASTTASLGELDSNDLLVYHTLQLGFNTIDTLAVSTGLPTNELTASLVRLQMRRLVIPEPGGYFKLVPPA